MAEPSPFLLQLRALAEEDARRRETEGRPHRILPLPAKAHGGVYACPSHRPANNVQEYGGVPDAVTTPPAAASPLKSPRTRSARRLAGGGWEGCKFDDGQHVMGFYQKDKQWYPAVVVSYCPLDHVYTLNWMDGDQLERRKEEDDLRLPTENELKVEFGTEDGTGRMKEEQGGAYGGQSSTTEGKLSPRSPVAQGTDPIRAASIAKAKRTRQENEKRAKLADLLEQKRKLERAVDRIANPRPRKQRKLWDGKEREELRLGVERLPDQHKALVADCLKNARAGHTPGVAAENGSYVFDFEKLSKRDLNKIEKAMNKYRAKCGADAADASSSPGEDDSD